MVDVGHSVHPLGVLGVQPQSHTVVVLDCNMDLFKGLSLNKLVVSTIKVTLKNARNNLKEWQQKKTMTMAIRMRARLLSSCCRLPEWTLKGKACFECEF